MSHDRTPITTAFGEWSTAAEVTEGIDLSRRRALVTGAASGIGVETARALAARGAAVTLAVRDVSAGQRVADEIAANTGNRHLDVRRLDLADLSSVAAFVDDWTEPLHVLVNNAGVMALPERTLTGAGVEVQLATNHLGHFALATGLHRHLAAADGARVVALSSSAHAFCPVLFDDLSFAFVEYSPFLGYGQSKTANVLFAVEGSRRWAEDGIAVNAVMPGGIATNLQRHMGTAVLERARREAGSSPTLKTPEQGAATTLLVATSPLLDGVGGRYFEDCHEASVVTSRAGSDGRHGVAAYALDPGNAERLWAVSEQLLVA